MSRRVLIVELEPFHGHIIYPQCVFLLDRGYDITLLISANLPEKDVFGSLPLTLVEVDPASRKTALLKRLIIDLFTHYDFILFNSLLSWPVIAFALLHRQPIRYILHNISGSRGLLNRLVISRAERIFVLSERNKAANWFPRPYKLSYFYPSFFDGFSDGILEQNFEGRIAFVIPGAVDPHRRNYQSLVDTFGKLVDSGLADEITIEIMGNPFTAAGQQLAENIQRYELDSVVKMQVKSFDSFELFAAKLRAAHFLLPLIDHNIIQHKDYNRSVAPSSLMLSRGFFIPIISSTDLLLDEDLEPFTISYPRDQLFDGLCRAVELFQSNRYRLLREAYRLHMANLFRISQQNYVEGSLATR